MLSRFAANIRAGFSLITRLTAGKVAAGMIVVASFVIPEGWRLLVTIAALGLLFAAAGAYLGIDLEVEREEENTDVFADPS
jgi:adenine/guanine phosphoribosyltransferase-like PRPP-binding protein